MSPVTELALFRVLQRQSPTDSVSVSHDNSPVMTAAVRQHLKTAAATMVAASGGYSFTFYRILEPAYRDCLLLVGGWHSAGFHWDEWIPSRRNQELLELLKEDVTVEWMFHVDLDRKALVDGVEGRNVVGVGRYRVKDNGAEGAKLGFVTAYKNVKRALDEYLGGDDRVSGGWRIEKGYKVGEDVVKDGMGGVGDEWVLFTGWEGRDEHMAFAQVKEFEEWKKLGEWVEDEGFEMMHVARLEL